MERNRLKEVLSGASIAFTEEESDAHLLDKVIKEYFVPGSQSCGAGGKSPLKLSELKMIYDLLVAACYKRKNRLDKECVKAKKPEAHALVAKLADDYELLVAVTYDIERFIHQMPYINKEEHPDRYAWYENKVSELLTTRITLLKSLPETEKAVQEAIGTA